MGCSFCLPKDETTKRRESVAGSFADTLPPEGAELEEEPEEVVLVPGSKGRGRRRRRHRRNNNGRGRDRDAPPPEPERGPGSNVATAKPSVWGNAERTAALTQHDDVQRRHQNAQSQHEHKAQPPQQRTRSSLPTAQGPPTCAAFFFPDKGLPCLRWLAGTRCRFGSRCKYLHEPTSLTAVCSFIGDARQSLDVCVYIISCNSIVEELLDAHYRGVRVRIITDDDQASKQSFHVGDSNSHGPQGRNNYLNRLHAVGVPIRTDTSRHHMHNKFCIIDNKILLTGSFNWTAGAVLRNQENVVVVGAGAGVAASHLIPLYKLEFLRLWHTFGKRVLSAHNPRTVSYRRPPFSSTPGHRFDALFFPDVDMTCRRVLEGGTCHNGNCKYFHGDSSLRRLIGYLDSARRSMDVCVLTITCNEIASAILRAHKRGVAVRVISDDEQAIRSGSDIMKMYRAGVPVRTDRARAHMHHKFCVIDNSLLMTGSFNWTASAVKFNQENLMVLEGAEGCSDAHEGRHVTMAQLFTDHFNTMWNNYQDNTPAVTTKVARQREAQTQGRV